MSELYYHKLEQVDKRIEYIATKRDKKLNKLKDKQFKVLEWAAKETEKAMQELGLTIPTEVKVDKHVSK